MLMDGLEYRRLLPRYYSWLAEHPIKKAPFLEKISTFFFQKPKKDVSQLPRYTIPKDILNIIVSHLPFEARQNWRVVSTYWHRYVDIHTPYWKEAERLLIQRELPPVLRNIFGGVQQIQKLPFFKFETTEMMQKFCESRDLRFRYHINFLRPQDLKHPITRGISPDGKYFFCLVVRNLTLNHALIMTIHETRSAWTISVSPWNFDYYAPFTEDIVWKKEELIEVADPDFEPAMRLLINGGRIRRAIGAVVKVPCDYELADPKDVPRWNWDML